MGKHSVYTFDATLQMFTVDMLSWPCDAVIESHSTLDLHCCRPLCTVDMLSLPCGAAVALDLNLDDWVLCRIYNKKGSVEKQQQKTNIIKPPEYFADVSMEEDDKKPEGLFNTAAAAYGGLPPVPPVSDFMYFGACDSIPRLYTDSSCSEEVVVSPEFTSEAQSESEWKSARCSCSSRAAVSRTSVDGARDCCNDDWSVAWFRRIDNGVGDDGGDDRGWRNGEVDDVASFGGIDDVELNVSLGWIYEHRAASKTTIEGKRQEKKNLTGS
ncbi:hypothetical protein ACFE04_028544 [Oxalis oulophora]